MATREYALDKKGCFLLIRYDNILKMRKFFKEENEKGKGMSMSAMFDAMCDILFSDIKLTAKEKRMVSDEIKSNLERRMKQRDKWDVSKEKIRDGKRRKAKRNEAKAKEKAAAKTAKKGGK